jgi:hypothetical protein
MATTGAHARGRSCALSIVWPSSKAFCATFIIHPPFDSRFLQIESPSKEGSNKTKKMSTLTYGFALIPEFVLACTRINTTMSTFSLSEFGIEEHEAFTSHAHIGEPFFDGSMRRVIMGLDTFWRHLSFHFLISKNALQVGLAAMAAYRILAV